MSNINWANQGTTANNIYVNVNVPKPEPDLSGEEVKEHTVEIVSRSGAVNLWRVNADTPLRGGNFVGEIKGYRTYLVTMREGGWLYVYNAHLYDWYMSRDRVGENQPTFDVWGEWYDSEETTGKDGEPYLLPKAEEET